MLRYAIITGFQPHIRTHVLQADVKSIPELLQAARIAEMANTTNDSAMSAHRQTNASVSKRVTQSIHNGNYINLHANSCLLYTSPSPRD